MDQCLVCPNIGEGFSCFPAPVGYHQQKNAIWKHCMESVLCGAPVSVVLVIWLENWWMLFFSKWVIPTMTHLGINMGMSRLFIIWTSVCLVCWWVPVELSLSGVKLGVLSQLASHYVCPIVPTLPLIFCQILVQYCHCSVVFCGSF